MHRPTRVSSSGVVPDPPAALAPRGAFLVGTLLFSAGALYFGTLAVVQPLLVTELVFTLGLRQLAPRPYPGSVVVGRLLICGGLAGSLSSPNRRRGAACPPSHVAGGGLHPCCGGRILLAFAQRGSPARRPPSTGGHRARLVGGRCLRESDHESAGRTGMAGVARALAPLRRGHHRRAGHVPPAGVTPRRALAASSPPCSSSTPASIVLGIEVFGEQLNTARRDHGQVLSLAMMALGVVLISKWRRPRWSRCAA